MEERSSSQAEYATLVQEAMAYPRDAFELTAFSFDTNDPREVAEKLGKFSDLVNKDILLANVAEQMIPYYQEDARILTHLFSLACRDVGIRIYFKVLYYGWKHELGITKAKDGKFADMLAKMVAMKDTRHQPGYGSEMFMEEPQGGPKGLDRLKKIFGM
jgi:hypothetical protein